MAVSPIFFSNCAITIFSAIEMLPLRHETVLIDLGGIDKAETSAVWAKQV
ncbi:MAG: hypothetical protein IPL33_09535 [Sphingobacteriales bacterium]|nr:hypothetical protein [Sphingobacteriales bacterium]